MLPGASIDAIPRSWITSTVGVSMTNTLHSTIGLGSLVHASPTILRSSHDTHNHRAGMVTPLFTNLWSRVLHSTLHLQVTINRKGRVYL